MRGRRWIGAALVGSMVVAGCSDDMQSPSATVPTLVPCGATTTYQYAAHDGVDPKLTSVDIYTPTADEDGCRKHPLVVWVHGGGWNEGDKNDNIADKVRLFTDAGYAFASVNYRLTDRSTEPPAPQYPVHDQDTADAVAWLLEHAEQIGIDTQRIALLGHSAGGGIVAAITTDDRYLGAHNLDLDAVRCAGSIDGEGYDIAVGATHPDPVVHDTYRSAFGTDPETWEKASPLRHIRAGKGIPGYFVAARGPDMRLDLHVEFVEALRAADVSVTVLDARELDHAEVSVNIGAEDDTVVTPALMQFLAGCFVTT